MKNPSSFYDEKYIHGRMRWEDTTSRRWEDNGLFFEAAVTTSKLADKIGRPAIVDIGCGRGFIIRHLRNLGHIADGYEYGDAALKDSVCGAKFCDLTAKLPIPDGAYGLGVCTGVLSHVPEESVPNALSELRRIVYSKGLLFINVLNHYTPMQSHHRTFKPNEWWKDRFAKARWLYASEHDEFLKSRGCNTSPGIWAAVFEAV